MSSAIHPTPQTYDTSTHTSPLHGNNNNNALLNPNTPNSGGVYTDKYDTSTDHNRGTMDTTTGPQARPSLFNRIRASSTFQRVMRILQFLSSFISLILFSYRLHKVKRLASRVSHASGAVEGILAAAVLYTLALMLLNLLSRRPGSRLGGNLLTWVLVVLDIAFMGAFIAVACLTNSRHGGDSAACSKANNDSVTNFVNSRISHGAACNLPWGTFVLAIVSTLLHLATAIFHKTKEHHRQKKLDREAGQRGTRGNQVHSGI